jgi:PAS domain S-box-containing protein
MATSKSDLFELIVESSTDFAIFSVQSDGTIASWNVGAERLFGYPEAEIIGSSADVLFVTEDRESGAPERERSLSRANGRAMDERWHRRKDGSLLWASGLMMPLKDKSGGFVKIVRDLTEQHRHQEQIRTNEERFRVLATSIPQLVFRTRHDGDRTWGSPQWIDFTGLSLDESLGFGWLEAIHPEDRDLTQSAWQDAIDTGEYYVEHRVRRQADGAYRWHQTRARPVGPEDAGASDWVGTMTDIHDLRGLQDRQQVLLAELQHRTRNLLALVESIAKQTIRTHVSLEAFSGEFSDRLRALSRVQSLLARSEHQRLDLQQLVEA